MTMSPMTTSTTGGRSTGGPSTGGIRNGATLDLTGAPATITGGSQRTRQDWMGEGSCHGKTDVFFAPHAERPQARARREAQARLICQECPSLDPCRTHARMHREYGFWGGESEEDRARAGFSVPWPIGVNRRRGNLAATG